MSTCNSVYGKCTRVYFRITTETRDVGKRKPQSRNNVRLGADDKRGICTRDVSAYLKYRIQEGETCVKAFFLFLERQSIVKPQLFTPRNHLLGRFSIDALS